MKLDCANIFCVFGAIARCLDNNPGAATRLRDATARDARGPSPAQLHGARLLPIDATSRVVRRQSMQTILPAGRSTSSHEHLSDCTSSLFVYVASFWRDDRPALDCWASEARPTQKAEFE
jgi:hypothetical protein